MSYNHYKTKLLTLIKIITSKKKSYKFVYRTNINPMNLVIVESPAKAKTIEKFLGKDFKVVSCFGHISDLPSKELGVNVDGDFNPNYIVTDDKKKVVKELKLLADKAETVWLASDEDREGEAIAWHLCKVLKLDEKTTDRIVFHEITKSAIEEALKNPRTVNMNMVRAQQARQIVDKLVGFELLIAKRPKKFPNSFFFISLGIEIL